MTRPLLQRETPTTEVGMMYTRTDEERACDYYFIADRLLKKVPRTQIHEELNAVRDYKLSARQLRYDCHRIEADMNARFLLWYSENSAKMKKLTKKGQAEARKALEEIIAAPPKKQKATFNRYVRG